MNSPRNDDSQPSKEQSLEQANEALLEEAEVMIWALLDEQIEPQDAQKLEALLKENDAVRQHYIKCTQMHNDLMRHFQAEPDSPESPTLPQSPILGSLGDLRPGTDTLPPVSE